MMETQHPGMWALHLALASSWLSSLEQRGVPLFDLSSRRRTVWFPTGLTTNNTIAFVGVDGKKARRDLCGYRTITKLTGETYQRHWHFGLEALPILYPVPVLALKSHVVFTLDGKHVTGDGKTQHRSRRSQCKDWWNDKWRDLTLAAVTYLTQGSTSLSLPISPESNLAMEWRPLKYQAPRGYSDGDVRAVPTDDIHEDDEHDDDDDASK